MGKILLYTVENVIYYVMLNLENEEYVTGYQMVLVSNKRF